MQDCSQLIPESERTEQPSEYGYESRDGLRLSQHSEQRRQEQRHPRHQYRRQNEEKQEYKHHIATVGASCNLHTVDPQERKKNLEEAKRFIDLAHEFKCPYIRVFPNNFPKDEEKNATMDRMAKGLLELADHAKGSNVSVLIESHGDLLWIEDLEKVISNGILLVPLRIGSGIRTKILDAFRLGIPVITTAVGIEGIGAKKDLHYYEATEADDYLKAIEYFQSNSDALFKMRIIAKQFFDDNFNLKVVVQSRIRKY